MPLADFTALLPLRVRASDECYSHPFAGRAPLGIFPLQGFPRLHDEAALHRLSSLPLCLVCLSAADATLRSLPRAEGGFFLLRGRLPS
jgi:hypothetical protein